MSTRTITANEAEHVSLETLEDQLNDRALDDAQAVLDEACLLGLGAQALGLSLAFTGQVVIAELTKPGSARFMALRSFEVVGVVSHGDYP